MAYQAGLLLLWVSVIPVLGSFNRVGRGEPLQSSLAQLKINARRISMNFLCRINVDVYLWYFQHINHTVII